MRASLILLLTLIAIPLGAGALPADVGRPQDIARSYSGAKVRLVNLWATWCIPCVSEMDDLKALDRDYRDEQLQLLAVSLDDAIPGDRAETKKKVAGFLSKKAIKFDTLYYTGRIPLLQDYYHFEGEIPMTLLFDRHGKERARYQGRIKPDLVRSEIEKLLKEK